MTRLAQGASKHPPQVWWRTSGRRGDPEAAAAAAAARRHPLSRSPKTGTFNVGSICCASFSVAACCVLISLLMVTCDMQMSGSCWSLRESQMRSYNYTVPCDI